MIGEEFEKLGNPQKLANEEEDNEGGAADIEMAQNSQESAGDSDSESSMSEAARERFD